MSVGSKVWSNRYDRIPDLLDWCDHLGNKIVSNVVPTTGSGLDYLPVGEELDEVPEGIIAMAWAYESYEDPPLVSFTEAGGNAAKMNLLDFDLEVVESRRGMLTFAVKAANIEWRGVFSYGGTDFFRPASANEPELIVELDSEEITIEDYLNEVLPTMYRSDLSAIDGQSLSPVPPALQAFDNDSFESIDWSAARVEITAEKVASAGHHSIFDWLRARLIASDATVVFCDDGAGEMADFISVHETPEGPRVKMYHCKASEEAEPGNRSKDLEIVCAQAIKSCVWINPDRLLSQLRYRVTLPSVPGYEKGDEATANAVLAPQIQRHVQFDTYIVQPGVQREGRAERLSNLLAAARDYLKDGGGFSFGVIGS